MTESAIEQSRCFIYESDLMNFKWSNENKMYIAIKLDAIFQEFTRSLEKDFLNIEKEMKLVVMHNRVALREFPDRDNDPHPIIMHNLETGTSYAGIKHFNDNTSLFSQDVTDIDILYQVNKYVLSQIKRLASDNIVKTIIHHFVDTLEKINKDENCRNFEI
jgi:hypothetical protein